jgi:uncharacterized membrane protein
VIGSSWIWPAIIMVSAIGTGTLVIADILPPIRHLLSLWFLLVCPGMAYVRLLPIRDSLTQWTLAVALSLAMDTVVAAFMLYTGNWSPDWGLVALIAICLGGVLYPKSRLFRGFGDAESSG